MSLLDPRLSKQRFQCCGIFALALAASILPVLVGCGRCGSGSYYRTGIHDYSGDGVIRDVSQPSGFFGSHGYAVEFESFDLGGLHVSNYQCSGLPTLGHASAEVRFLIEDPKAEKRKDNLTATLSITVRDGSGKIVATMQGPLRNFVWSSPLFDRTGVALYKLGSSSFIPDNKERYTIDLHYSGDASLQSRTGRIYIWCGCGGS